MHRHSRRSFLSELFHGSLLGASLLEAAALRAAEARALSKTAAANLFDITRVADGVYAAVARQTALLNCNAAIFENSDSLLVVDAHSKPSAAASLVAQLRQEVSRKPIRYLVNTHFHWDHTQGAPAYRKLEPQARIIASTATRDLLERNGIERMKQSVESLPPALEAYRQQREKAATPADKQRLDRRIRETQAYIEEMKNYRPELPDITIDRGLVLHDKAHDLQILFLGLAHTAGDVVVFCPQKKVVATGDMLHGFPPYIPDGYPKQWPATLRTVRALEFDTIVGGHGAVQRDRRRLDQMAAYIEELADQVAEKKQRGIPAAQIQQEIGVESLRSAREYCPFFAQQLLAYDSTYAGRSEADIIAQAVREGVAATHDALSRPQ